MVRLISLLAWTLGAPIEKVILDNEEKSTTYAETGGTGLLLGTVKLPAPRSQHNTGFLYHVSYEARYEVSAGTVYFRIWDGVEEVDVDGHSIWSTDYLFDVLFDVGASNYPVPRSQKGNTQLELRAYLIGVQAYPTAPQYCRNCVLTVVPLYKT